VENYYQNKVITGITVKDTFVELRFDDRRIVFDSEHRCCEHRYFKTDDDPYEYLGYRYLNFTVEHGPETKDPKQDMYTASGFLRIHTTRGVFVVQAYNNHNGYYGGINVVLRAEGEDPIYPDVEPPPSKTVRDGEWS
jgi:hypothetical protein